MQVLKIGGELLEAPGDLLSVVTHVRSRAAQGPLVVVHGGGRELSAELTRRGAAPRMVDGIRVTDAGALAAAVSVLAGTINTRLVAALTQAGVRAVGLTGADGGLLRSSRAPRVRSRSGALVDLGSVGIPDGPADMSLVRTLCAASWVPVVASIGIDQEGGLLNVNADVAAAHLAVSLGAVRLTLLGATDGVFDEQGQTIAELPREDADRLVATGAARDGMAAKLQACLRALAGGVADVRILDGRAIDLAAGGTRVVVERRIARVS